MTSKRGINPSKKSAARMAANNSTKADVEGAQDKIQRERYRVLIEDVADGFYEVDLKGNFKFFNDALCRIFGYSRRKIQNSNFTEFMDENNAAIAYEAFNKIFRIGKGVVDISWEIIRKDGERRHLEISASLIMGNDGKPPVSEGLPGMLPIKLSLSVR